MAKAKRMKARKIFNLYNFAIIFAIILILVSLYIIFEPKIDISKFIKDLTTTNEQTVDNNKTEEIKTENGEGIIENQARKIAKNKFESLGESDVDKDSLQVKKLRRGQEEFYYISSLKNTMEIRIKDGKITRINSTTVED